jgi:hypothetical protein
LASIDVDHVASHHEKSSFVVRQHDQVYPGLPLGVPLAFPKRMLKKTPVELYPAATHKNKSGRMTSFGTPKAFETCDTRSAGTPFGRFCHK